MKLRVDSEFVEGTAQKIRVERETEEIELADGCNDDLVAGRRQVVVEGAVASLAHRFEIAVDGLAGFAERGELSPDLLGLGEAEPGTVDRDREAAHRVVGPRRSQSAVERGEAALGRETDERPTGRWSLRIGARDLPLEHLVTERQSTARLAERESEPDQRNSRTEENQTSEDEGEALHPRDPNRFGSAGAQVASGSLSAISRVRGGSSFLAVVQPQQFRGPEPKRASTPQDIIHKPLEAHRGRAKKPIPQRSLPRPHLPR